MINEKINNMIVELEKKKTELDSEYRKKLNKALIGKRFYIDTDIIIPVPFVGRDYKNGDIVEIDSAELYDDCELFVFNKEGERFEFLDIDAVVFVED